MREVICGIYKIENLVNGKVYIGQSIDIYSRFTTHRNSLNRGDSNCTCLQRAWNKYGESSFEFSVVELCEEHLLDKKEREYICLYDACNSGYNIEDGGNANKHLSNKTKEKLRNAHLGKCLPDEVKQKMSNSRKGDKNPMYGKNHTEESKQKISQKNKGKTGHKISDEQKEVLRLLNTGKTLSDETKLKISISKRGKTPYNKDLRPVYCVELDIIFENATVAAKDLNLRSDRIIACCKGIKHRKTCGGYHWKYADEIINHNEINDLAV